MRYSGVTPGETLPEGSGKALHGVGYRTNSARVVFPQLQPKTIRKMDRPIIIETRPEAHNGARLV